MHWEMKSCESNNNFRVTKTEQKATKPCAYLIEQIVLSSCPNPSISGKTSKTFLCYKISHLRGRRSLVSSYMAVDENVLFILSW